MTNTPPSRPLPATQQFMTGDANDNDQHETGQHLVSRYDRIQESESPHPPIALGKRQRKSQVDMRQLLDSLEEEEVIQIPDETEDNFGDKKQSKLKNESTTRSGFQLPTLKSRKISEKEAQAMRLPSKPNAKNAPARSAKDTQQKAAVLSSNLFHESVEGTNDVSATQMEFQLESSTLPPREDHAQSSREDRQSQLNAVVDDSLIDTITPFLKMPEHFVLASQDHSNAFHETKEQGILGYAKLAGNDWAYYIADLKINIGRSPESNLLPETEADETRVDVDLGPNKSVSRLHAQILWESESMKWRMLCLVGTAFRLTQFGFTEVIRDTSLMGTSSKLWALR